MSAVLFYAILEQVEPIRISNIEKVISVYLRNLECFISNTFAIDSVPTPRTICTARAFISVSRPSYYTRSRFSV